MTSPTAAEAEGADGKKSSFFSSGWKRSSNSDLRIKVGNATQTYVIGKKLGKGNTAVVKEGLCKETGQLVAIKIRAKGTKKEKEGFRKECMAMHFVQHHHCVSLYAVHEDKANYYMVLELVEGGSVMDRILEVDVFTESDTVHVMKGCLTALQYLHSQGIAHRDLKPDNLMFMSKDPNSSNYNTIKLADFGFAKFTDPQEVMKTVCGTPLYIAPEVLEADMPDHPGYGCEVDIWSIGVILYLLLCGFPPFIDQDVWQLFELVRAAKVNFPSPYWDNVSDEAKDLVKKMLVPDRTKRYTPTQCLSHPFIKTLGQNRLRKLHSFHKAFTLIRKLPIFANIDAEVLQQITESLKKVEVAPGDKIINTGSQATCMYFIFKGDCVVVSNGKQIDTLSTGDFFGEIALACDVRRTADVIATGTSNLQLYELSRVVFLELLESYPALETRVAEVADLRVRRISQSFEPGPGGSQDKQRGKSDLTVHHEEGESGGDCSEDSSHSVDRGGLSREPSKEEHRRVPSSEEPRRVRSSEVPRVPLHELQEGRDDAVAVESRRHSVESRRHSVEKAADEVRKYRSTGESKIEGKGGKGVIRSSSLGITKAGGKSDGCVVS
jgi:calcium/calmodulin-dependent protein kinase I